METLDKKFVGISEIDNECWICKNILTHNHIYMTSCCCLLTCDTCTGNIKDNDLYVKCVCGSTVSILQTKINFKLS